MTAPLPSGSPLQALPTAPSIDPRLAVVDVDPMANIAKGIDFAGQFARIGQLRSKIELEDAQRKADKARADAARLEADLIQRDLEDKFNIEKATRALVEEKARLDLEQAGRLAPLQIDTARGVLAAQGQAKALTDLAIGAATDEREVDKIRKKLTIDQMRGAFAPGTNSISIGALNLLEQKGATQNATGPSNPEIDERLMRARSELKREMAIEGKTGEPDPKDVRVRAGLTEAPKEFLDTYAEFKTAGSTKAQSNINKLDEAINILRKPGTIAASGAVPGLLGDIPVVNRIAKALTTDESRQPRLIVEQVIQESLKTILGSQFTEKEGLAMMARAFDPYLSEETNADRISVIKEELKQMLASKEEAVAYFEKYKTLDGFKPRGMTDRKSVV